MELFNELMANRILWISMFAWALAQILKVIFLFVFQKKIDFSRLISAGGMPSSHSALVMSMAALIGLEHGFNTTYFSMMSVFALVVMYDATGVRQAAGKQAKILNRIMDEYFTSHELKEEHLKELIGHTPFQVFVGGILGLVVAFMMY